MQSGGSTVEARMRPSRGINYAGPPSSKARLPLPSPRRSRAADRARIMSEAELERAERSWALSNGLTIWSGMSDRDDLARGNPSSDSNGVRTAISARDDGGGDSVTAQARDLAMIAVRVIKKRTAAAKKELLR